MHRAQEQVLDFHRACGLRTEEGSPFVDWDDVRGVRWSLIEEEVFELTEAMALENVEKMCREVADVLYVIYGLLVAQGIDIEPYFDEVHRANMTKASGPHREDGKQLKPEGWQPPDMEMVTRRVYGKRGIREKEL